MEYWKSHEPLESNCHRWLALRMSEVYECTPAVSTIAVRPSMACRNPYWSKGSDLGINSAKTGLMEGDSTDGSMRASDELTRR